MIPLTGTSRLPTISPPIYFPIKFCIAVHMRKRAGPLAEISFEFAEIIGRRDENFPYEHASPLTGMKSNKSCRHFLLGFMFVL